MLAHAVPVRACWWRWYVKSPWWPEALDVLPDYAEWPGYQRVTRRDLFDLATDPSPVGRVRLLVAVYAWGTDRSGFLVGRRARTFTKTDITAVAERLVAASDLLHTAGPGRAEPTTACSRSSRTM